MLKPTFCPVPNISISCCAMPGVGAPEATTTAVVIGRPPVLKIGPGVTFQLDSFAEVRSKRQTWPWMSPA